MKTIMALVALLALAACGNDAQTRMLTGAGIGAVGGALLGGITTPQQQGYGRHRGGY